MTGDWQEEHQKRVAAFPEDVREAHKHAVKHRKEIEASGLCGCFYCISVFKPGEISDWVDEGEGTAMCPECGIDAVIGSASGFPITQEFLEKMYKYWFD